MVEGCMMFFLGEVNTTLCNRITLDDFPNRTDVKQYHRQICSNCKLDKGVGRKFELRPSGKSVKCIVIVRQYGDNHCLACHRSYLQSTDLCNVDLS